MFYTLLLTAGCAVTFAGLVASHHNYPGGHALHQLHSLGQQPGDAQLHQNVSVHIGALAAMTGVSRFGELRQDWTYSKVGAQAHGLRVHASVPCCFMLSPPLFVAQVENQTDAKLSAAGFTYLISESPNIDG